MGDTRTVQIRFNAEFYDSISRAAELKGMIFSEFVRFAASRLASEVYLEEGLEFLDLNGWHMQAGGDFSEARAAKDPNYRKRNVLKKIDAAKKEAAKRTNKGRADSL